MRVLGTLIYGMVLAVLCGTLQVAAESQVPVENQGEQKIAYQHNNSAGFTRHELASGDRLLGWQVADRWYVGRAKSKVRRIGEPVLRYESLYDQNQADFRRTSLALVWQRNDSQNLALSTQGLRLTKRFH